MGKKKDIVIVKSVDEGKKEETKGLGMFALLS
jgi:hypothetical protein